MSSASGRRIVAVVLPQLACEVARPGAGRAAAGRVEAAPPLAVLIDQVAVGAAKAAGAGTPTEEGARTIDAVDEAAHARGVRPGQRVSEAVALTAGLEIVHVDPQAIEGALAAVADVALGLGPTVAVGAPDTVWVDVTGAAHLWGGEAALLAELAARVRGLGHAVRCSLAEGPRLAQALARFGGARLGGARGGGGDSEAIGPLPVHALLQERGDEAVVSLLARLGVETVADLRRLPAGVAAARLGDRAQDVLALANGRDAAPLYPYVPTSRLVEELTLEEGVEIVGALVFIARGLVSRAAARLAARGEATSHIALELGYDRAIAELRFCAGELHGGGHGGGQRARAAPSSLRGVIAGVDAAIDAPQVLHVAQQVLHGVANDVGGAASAHAPLTEAPRAVSVAIELPAPLAHESDLLRAVKAKIEALVLLAPVVTARLVLTRIGPAPEIQLAMGARRLSARAIDPDALPALLSELSAEIGAERVGVLTSLDDHRPEARTALEPPRLDEAYLDPAKAALRAARAATRAEKAARAAFGEHARDFALALLPSPLRLLGSPVAITARGGVAGVPGGSRSEVAPPHRPEAEGARRLTPGMAVLVAGRAFEVAHTSFDRRLDGARWWTTSPAARDYHRVWLRAAPSGTAERGGAGTAERAGRGAAPRGSARGLSESSGLSGRSEPSDSSERHTAEGVGPACFEAWVYVDRRSGQTLIQGLWE